MNSHLYALIFFHFPPHPACWSATKGGTELLLLEEGGKTNYFANELVDYVKLQQKLCQNRKR